MNVSKETEPKLRPASLCDPTEDERGRLLLTAPLRVLLLITDRCNLSCAHCSATALASKNELSTEEWKTILKQCREIGVQSVNIQGGEPMMRKDFFEIIEFASSIGLFVYVPTNGYFINPKNAKLLAQSKVRSMQISLEGPRDVHEQIRGQGSYDRAVKAIETLVQHNIPVSTMSILSTLTVNHIEWSINFAQQSGASGVSFERLIPVGNGTRMRLNTLSKECLESAYKRIQYARQNVSNGFWISCSDPVFSALELQDSSIQNISKKGKACGGCSAGLTVIVIGSDGKVYPCSHLPIIIGDIKCQSLLDIWNKSTILNAIRHRDEFRGKCKTCSGRYFCGGCRAASYAFTNDFLAEDPQCFHEL